MTDKIAVFAFDGMDKKLVEELGLENIMQTEFSSYNNSEGISRIMTGELFTTFITGTLSESHGIDTGRMFENKYIDFFEKKAQSYRFMRKFKGYRQRIYELAPLIDAEKVSYERDDIRESTLFEEIENSRSMFLPVKDGEDRLFWQCGIQMAPLENGFGVRKTSRFYNEHNFDVKKDKVMSELKNDIVSPRDFLMVHFHRPDFDHHLYYDPALGQEDKEWIERTYHELDEFAAELKKAAIEAGYDKVIFMSDHGLPTLNAHNTNCFYSCNVELFGKSNPHITDFYDRILEEVVEE